VLKFLFGAIMYVIVPAIMLAFIIIAFGVAGESKDDAESAGAGIAAGFISFATYATGTAAAHSSFPKFSPNHPPSFDLIAFIVGITIGLLAPLIVTLASKNEATGVVTLVLTFSGCAGLYSYLFATSLHRFTLYASLSAGLGWVLSGVFYRTEAHKIFS
jgi:hypothetical protein